MLLFGKIALGFAGTALAGAGLLCSQGLVEVNVVEKHAQGHHVHVIAPALLLTIGTHFAPRDNMAEASAEIQPWLPTIRATFAELRECDDIAFVEVKEPGQQVRVAKSGGSIVVDVEREDESVHVSAPIRAMSSAFEELGAVPPANGR
ncbi:MAG: hypothetical protein ACRD5M_13865 [Candidatus Acidiferrales bacterium]